YNIRIPPEMDSESTKILPGRTREKAHPSAGLIVSKPSFRYMILWGILPVPEATNLEMPITPYPYCIEVKTIFPTAISSSEMPMPILRLFPDLTFVRTLDCDMRLG